MAQLLPWVETEPVPYEPEIPGREVCDPLQGLAGVLEQGLSLRCQCRFKMFPFCRNKMSPIYRFYSEKFSGSVCSSSPFGEGPNMPALRFSLSR